MAFWKKFYKSRYTGREIDAAVAKAGDATKVVANPTLAGTEAALTGLEVGDTKYKIEAGSGGGGISANVIDFGGNTIQSGGDDVTISGIYNQMSNIDYTKPVLLTNVKLTVSTTQINRVPVWAETINITQQDGANVYAILLSIRTTKTSIESVKLNVYSDDVVYWG